MFNTLNFSAACQNYQATVAIFIDDDEINFHDLNSFKINLNFIRAPLNYCAYQNSSVFMPCKSFCCYYCW